MPVMLVTTNSSSNTPASRAPTTPAERAEICSSSSQLNSAGSRTRARLTPSPASTAATG